MAQAAPCSAGSSEKPKRAAAGGRWPAGLSGEARAGFPPLRQAASARLLSARVAARSATAASLCWVGSSNGGKGGRRRARRGSSRRAAARAGLSRLLCPSCGAGPRSRARGSAAEPSSAKAPRALRAEQEGAAAWQQGRARGPEPAPRRGGELSPRLGAGPGPGSRAFRAAATCVPEERPRNKLVPGGGGARERQRAARLLGRRGGRVEASVSSLAANAEGARFEELLSTFAVLELSCRAHRHSTPLIATLQ